MRLTRRIRCVYKILLKLFSQSTWEFSSVLGHAHFNLHLADRPKVELIDWASSLWVKAKTALIFSFIPMDFRSLS